MGIFEGFRVQKAQVILGNKKTHSIEWVLNLLEESVILKLLQRKQKFFDVSDLYVRKLLCRR